MNKSSNYDTKSSVLSIDYKIPYDVSQGSLIVEHLEESQEELEFLKIKLTEAYEKLQKQIHVNIELSDNNEELMVKLKAMQDNWQAEAKENRKLKEVMETVLKNRKMLEQEIQYTHKRYKKMLQEKEEQYQIERQSMEKSIRRLKKQNETLEQSILEQEKSRKQSVSSSKVDYIRQRKLEEKIEILEGEIKKLTAEKVTQVTRLKHEIECYQRSMSPLRQRSDYKPTSSRPLSQIQYFDAEQNIQNINSVNIMQNSTVSNVQSKVTVTSTKTDQDSIGKWNKSKVTKNAQLTDDQKLTRAQMEKKKIEGQLIKIERLKRHAPEDRDTMDQLEKKIYELDSEISSLKRKIRQKY